MFWVRREYGRNDDDDDDDDDEFAIRLPDNLGACRSTPGR